MRISRRLILGTATAVALPSLARAAGALTPMTDGPFYPPRAWRERWTDWDADLTRVERGAPRTARGEHLGLQAAVVDAKGQPIDNAEVEIWQCDALGAYRHPNVRADAGTFDDGFQGFGTARSAKDGSVRFRTIKPVPYPGRTPHIHVKLRHASFGELTSQLFLANDPGNARDFLWRQVPATDRSAIELVLADAPAGSGLRWVTRQRLEVPA